ncbi:hypothetical protein [Streptomyces sp. NPDC048350]|uniref:hypothetical protein n=1 Tax=Streptomyces sp. NPDC048350 TaxID=3365538 RepID=UPI00372446C3
MTETHVRRLFLAVMLVTATLALAAVIASTTATRQAATRTLDLLPRLVPWYTPCK